jgi:hypothetical protein
MDEMDRLRSEDRSSDVRAWNDGGWNDFALRDVWLTAKEEYQVGRGFLSLLSCRALQGYL